MGKTTKISYCDSTINPVMGCSGCELYDPKPKYNHCYAASLCRRYAGRKGWPKSFDEPEHFPGRLEKALRWSDLTGKDRSNKPWLNGYPRLVFVNDMGDGFAPASPEANVWLEPHIKAMKQSPHIWLLLTKWLKRMMEFFKSYGHVPRNFWLGTTVMSQDTIWRVIELIRHKNGRFQFTAWVSCGPLLGSIEIHKYLSYYPILPDVDPGCDGIDFVVVEGESGPNARPMNPDWARDIRDQCQATQTSYFHKQNGEWLDVDTAIKYSLVNTYTDTSLLKHFDDHKLPYVRVGKEAAGCFLDSREWHEMPKV